MLPPNFSFEHYVEKNSLPLIGHMCISTLRNDLVPINQ